VQGSAGCALLAGRRSKLPDCERAGSATVFIASLAVRIVTLERISVRWRLHFDPCGTVPRARSMAMPFGFQPIAGTRLSMKIMMVHASPSAAAHPRSTSSPACFGGLPDAQPL
jgi:hypothetical protein